MSINIIAEETLLHIFSYLDTKSIIAISKVCKLWHIISDDKVCLNILFKNTVCNGTYNYNLIGNVSLYWSTFSMKSKIDFKNSLKTSQPINKFMQIPSIMSKFGREIRPFQNVKVVCNFLYNPCCMITAELGCRTYYDRLFKSFVFTKQLPQNSRTFYNYILEDRRTENKYLPIRREAEIEAMLPLAGNKQFMDNFIELFKRSIRDAHYNMVKDLPNVPKPTPQSNCLVN